MDQDLPPTETASADLPDTGATRLPTEPSAELPTETEPSAELPTETEPSAELPTETEPSADLPTETEPSAELSTETEPSAELFTELQPPAHSDGQNWNVLRVLNVIITLIKSGFKTVDIVLGILKECYSLLKLIAHKHKIKPSNESDFGSHVHIDKHGVLQTDTDKLNQILRGCNNITMVCGEFPFLGLTEDEQHIVCEVCPTTRLANYTGSSARDSHRFSVTKNLVYKHLTSQKHGDNMLTEFKKQEEATKIISRDAVIGQRIFTAVYKAMKWGDSFNHLIDDLAVLHHFGLDIGSINHSTCTLRKIKDTLARTLRKFLRVELQRSLESTKKPRPLSELFDKMTHNRRTGQMQMFVAPLLNETELLSVGYLDNYLVDPGENRYSHMISMVRETADMYYDRIQVENACADGAYVKAQPTIAHYKSSLDLPDTAGDWITVQWDMAHNIDLSDGQARKEVPTIEAHFMTAQSVTKVFRWGKAYHEAFLDNQDMAQRCVSVADFLPAVGQDGSVEVDSEDTEDDEVLIGMIGQAHYAPVLMSEMKFAAHGAKFLYNYIKNLPHYVLNINNRINDDTVPAKNREAYRGLLAKITIQHISCVYYMYEMYNILAKCQHGVSRVNQLPWHYYERIETLKQDLVKITEKGYQSESDGVLKVAKEKLKLGEFETGTLICTEERRPLRSSTTHTPSIEEEIERARSTARQYVNSLTSDIAKRIKTSPTVELMRQVFVEFNTTALSDLLGIASKSNRTYGDVKVLQEQLALLEQRWNDQTPEKADSDINHIMSRWLLIFKKQNLYKDIAEILHFALCCFVKVPLETPAETIGSVINQHGRKQRCALSPGSLSSEVQIAWNGPQVFDLAAKDLISEALKDYFLGHTQSGKPHFHHSSKLRLISSTVAKHMNKKSRISFHRIIEN